MDSEQLSESQRSLHELRKALALEIRQEWQEDMNALCPDLSDISEKELQALVLAAVGSGESVSVDDITALVEKASQARFMWGLFRMAILGLVDIALDDNSDLLVQISPGAAVELGPQLAQLDQLRR
jgi:hypothetical protein